MEKIALFLLIVLFPIISNANEQYRTPRTGDYGDYYIIESEVVNNGLIRVLCSRIGKGRAYTDFTEILVDCSSQKYLGIAERYEDGAKEKPTKSLKKYKTKSKWASLVTGSSKYDLVQYICKKYR